MTSKSIDELAAEQGLSGPPPDYSQFQGDDVTFRCPNCGGDEFHAWYVETVTQTCTLFRRLDGTFEPEYTGTMVGDSEGQADEAYVCAVCEWRIDIGEWKFDPKAKPELEEVDEAYCRNCGCTEDSACAGGCHWIEDTVEQGDLCSRCAFVLEGGSHDVGNPDPDEKPEGPSDHLDHRPEAGNEARA